MGPIKLFPTSLPSTSSPSSSLAYCVGSPSGEPTHPPLPSSKEWSEGGESSSHRAAWQSSGEWHQRIHAHGQMNDVREKRRRRGKWREKSPDTEQTTQLHHLDIGYTTCAITTPLLLPPNSTNHASIRQTRHTFQPKQQPSWSSPTTTRTSTETNLREASRGLTLPSLGGAVLSCSLFHQSSHFLQIMLLLLLMCSASVLVSADHHSHLHSSPQQPAVDSSILAVFRHQYEGREVELERMVADPTTNRLYVGAVNHLFDLNPDVLSVREHAITGPRPDSVMCTDALRLENCPPQQLIPTDSHTKALAIYPDANKLIECTSLYQGRCRVRNLSNIQREQDVRVSGPGLVANDPVSSTVAFVGTGPAQQRGSQSSSSASFASFALTSENDDEDEAIENDEDFNRASSQSSSSSHPSASSSSFAALSSTPPRVLYLASTYTPSSNNPSRDSLRVPSIASRQLDSPAITSHSSPLAGAGGGRLFDYTAESIASASLMRLDTSKAPNFHIHYVGGFEVGGFAYFATRQPKYTSPGVGAAAGSSSGGGGGSGEAQQPVISKLARVCTQDPNFYSYTEAPLECRRGGTHYNLLQAIHVGAPGFDLAAALGIKPTDQVLYGVFAKGEGAERNSTGTGGNSALCAFPMRQVEAKFFENIRVCYNGQTRTNLPWFSSDTSCKPTQYSDADILCGKDVNPYIGGEIPIVANALLVDKTSLFTSIITSSVQTATVAFIGTSAGTLHKALLEAGSGGGGISRIYKSIQLTPGGGEPLLQDAWLDEKNGFLYVMSRHAVYKVNVRLCSPQAGDCHSCLATSDPYCGWCMKPAACTTQEVCDADAKNPKADWLNYKSGRCPFIRSIEPREQQITQQRELTVHMENAPHTFGTLYCSFTFPSLQRINVSASSSPHPHHHAATPSTQPSNPTAHSESKEPGHHHDGGAMISTTTTTISCLTPTLKNLLGLHRASQPPATTSPPGESSTPSSVVAQLAVVNAHDGSVVAATNFTFYDCHQLGACTPCASSRFPCDWCATSAKCVPNAEESCRGETLINSVARLGPSSRQGPDHCPRFASAAQGGGNIYVASGKRRRVVVQAHNLLETMGSFKCQYTLDDEARTHEKLATRQGDKIICEDMLFEFSSQLGLGNGTAVARFDILWSPTSSTSTSSSASDASFASATQPYHRLDNSDEMRVVIYKCPQLAPNCGLCLGLDTQRYSECGWCDNEGRCESRDECASGGKDAGAANGSSWLVKGLGMPICPHPKIEDFEPKKGPLSGGTRITIRGTNLGLSYEDVKDAIRVANAKCEVSEHEYVSSTKIVCYTRTLPTRQKQTQHVVFRLRDERRFTAVSSQMFTYADPQPKSFQPYRGPRSGGTDVTILGQDLDSGANFNVSIGSVPCEVRQRSSTMVVCRTGGAPYENRPDHVIVNADGSTTRINSLQFLYSANAEIDRVPRAHSILSGGISLDVHGRGFNLLQRPRMVVSYEGNLYSGAICDVVDDHLMVCRTPDIANMNQHTTQLEPHQDDLHHRESSSTSLRLDYGFDLDGTLTGNLTTERGFAKLVVQPNPRIHPFAERQQIRPGGDLVIKGTNLNSAASVRDVRVIVGELSTAVQCNVSALSASTLTCVLPTGELPDGVVDVYVHVGNMAVRVGEASQNLPYLASWLYWLAIGIAVSGLLLALLLFVLYKRKDTSHHKQMRYLQNQMNSIEMKVAQECKEAFHELQTNMNALAGSMPQGASFIPFLSYQDYSARILFPNLAPNYAQHAIFRDLAIEQERAVAVETGLRQLHRLLLNKTFLLSFVRTIDENKYLLLKDRAYVGSLLMVVLQERMDYCTDVLKLLLRELIRRNVESRFQPKILFRRADSVAERMLSVWFALLMYKFLRRGAGKQLYQLYWATKQQTEKGPQDALTLDARYSLSEEKLLRATFDFRELHVFVICEPGHGNSGGICDTPVRVLDCDSISQVKEKCLDAAYRSTPHSERPVVGDLDLELRTPAQRLLLQDLDSTSRCEAGVWRYNTLAHYKVENKATLALVPRGGIGGNTTSTTSQYNLSMYGGGGDAASAVGTGRDRISEKSSVTSLHHHLHHPISQSPTLISHKHYNTSVLSGLVNGNGTASSHHGHHHHHSKDHHHYTSSSNAGSTLRVYHLVRPAADHGPQLDNQEKMVTEIYLTRLLTMKGTIQRFIENMIEMIFSCTSGPMGPLPPSCIKYMFDFLDHQAEEHGIGEPDVPHAWKSNALPLRFWVNLIKNPDFIFDIPRPSKIEGSLNVVAQTLMDACSTQEHHLTKDSPSSKLLFANETERYRTWARRYYAEIRSLPHIREDEMQSMLIGESNEHRDRLEAAGNSHSMPKMFSVLNEIYAYVEQQHEPLMDVLSSNEFALQHQLPERLQQVLDAMSPMGPAMPAAMANGGRGGGGGGGAHSELAGGGGGMMASSGVSSNGVGGLGGMRKGSSAANSRFY